jgi:hypothetical protein
MKKKLFTTLLFCGLAFNSLSQTLEFSQVLLVSSLDIVPQGKVWKVESALANCTSHCNASIVVNNENIYTYVYQTGMPGTSSKAPAASNPTSFPIWLPEGTSLNIGSNVKYISVIEFNQ